MSLFKVFDIAGSGMSAQTVRLNTTASNLANADSAASSTGQTYRARYPVFRTLLDASAPDRKAVAGVQVAGIVESQAPLRKQYAPDNPLANKDGYIFLPNVNAVDEMVNMIAAARAYQNDTQVFETSKQLLLATLRLGQ